MKYYEDHEVGQVETAGTYVADKDEIVACAKKWDPQPFHIDENAARESIYGGLTAPSIYTIAISHWLGHQLPQMASMGLLGYEKMEFPNPVRPGDQLKITSTVAEMRESKTKTDRGIIRFKATVANQNDEAVMTFRLKVMVPKRPV